MLLPSTFSSDRYSLSPDQSARCLCLILQSLFFVPLSYGYPWSSCLASDVYASAGAPHGKIESHKNLLQTITYESAKRSRPYPTKQARGRRGAPTGGCTPSYQVSTGVPLPWSRTTAYVQRSVYLVIWAPVSMAARIWDPIGRLLSIHRHRGCLEADMRGELRAVAISLDGWHSVKSRRMRSVVRDDTKTHVEREGVSPVHCARPPLRPFVLARRPVTLPLKLQSIICRCPLRSTGIRAHRMHPSPPWRVLRAIPPRVSAYLQSTLSSRQDISRSGHRASHR